MKFKIYFLLIVVLLVFNACSTNNTNIVVEDNYEKIDDWEYSYIDIDEDRTSGMNRPTQSYTSTPMMSMEESENGMLGFSVGGAKDINNFRDNIENNYLPIPTDITTEGLYYDYYFDTGELESCEELFCPSYSMAMSRDPLSGEEIYYLSVGLNSGIKESDFQRKKLNLVIVLDISGSMSSSFDKYYYDQFGNYVEKEDFDTTDMNKTKMMMANEAIVDLMGHLEGDDRFGIVLFDDQGYLAKPLRYVRETDMESIEGHVIEVTPQGGTNMEAGMRLGTELFEEIIDADKSEYENRIIFLTDAMPNTGAIDENSLLGMLSKNSDVGLYTTFIGIGLDFNTQLIEEITKIKGANYYSVHSSSDFKERMDEGFEFMVTPLVFDLKLELEAKGYEIEKVYGSPMADEATGEIMYVNTLFPSVSEGGEVKGGLVLLRLRKLPNDGDLTDPLTIRVSYEDREGNEMNVEDRIDFPDREDSYYDNLGIRKGILLARYVDLMQNWLVDEREVGEEYSITKSTGILVKEIGDDLGIWERQSVDLTVNENYRELFEDFYDYFKEEKEAIGDTTLNQELEILYKLSNR